MAARNSADVRDSFTGNLLNAWGRQFTAFGTPLSAWNLARGVIFGERFGVAIMQPLWYGTPQDLRLQKSSVP
jgi:hypothetical protein